MPVRKLTLTAARKEWKMVCGIALQPASLMSFGAAVSVAWRTLPGLSTLVVSNGATKLTCSSRDVFADWGTLGGGVIGSCSVVAGLSTLLVASSMSCGAAVDVALGGGGVVVAMGSVGGGGGCGCGYCCPEVGTGSGGGGRMLPGLSTLVVFADWSRIGGGVSGFCPVVAGLPTLLVLFTSANIFATSCIAASILATSTGPSPDEPAGLLTLLVAFSRAKSVVTVCLASIATSADVLPDELAGLLTLLVANCPIAALLASGCGVDATGLSTLCSFSAESHSSIQLSSP